MPRFNVRLSGLKMDRKGFTKAFDTKVTALMKGAARAWLKAVFLQVPVWTGFARGSLKFADGPNGNLSRFLNVAIPTNANHAYPKWYYHPGRGRVLKTPENAGRFAHYTFTQTRHVYTFTYSSSVVHFLIEDFFGRMSPTAPWLSGVAGKLAWDNYFEVNKASLPKGSKFNKPAIVIDIKESQLHVIQQSIGSD